MNSRSITIAIERHDDGQRKLKRFDSNHPDAALDAANAQILLWRREVELNPDPEMPARVGMNRIVALPGKGRENAPSRHPARSANLEGCAEKAVRSFEHDNRMSPLDPLLQQTFGGMGYA